MPQFWDRISQKQPQCAYQISKTKLYTALMKNVITENLGHHSRKLESNRIDMFNGWATIFVPAPLLLQLDRKQLHIYLIEAALFQKVIIYTASAHIQKQYTLQNCKFRMEQNWTDVSNQVKQIERPFTNYVTHTRKMVSHMILVIDRYRDSHEKFDPG